MCVCVVASRKFILVSIVLRCNVITSMLPHLIMLTIFNSIAVIFLLFFSFNLNAYDTLMAFNVTHKWIWRISKIIEHICVISFSAVT